MVQSQDWCKAGMPNVRIFIDWIMKIPQQEEIQESGSWKFTSKLDNLDFTDDIALISASYRQMKEKTERLVQEAKKTGLKVNEKKSKLLKINSNNDRKIKIGGNEIEEVNEFTYLGAVVSKE
ncbi:uncharacterized protein LOC117120280 [Anneissia japonica]|uniref:uncharacterized protein LOC117120280 n=1 Tax=Anneissia japonica TaxID=1529436 RepID=UPI001425A282|nr:uncharacterized protein LOC117120280 [Anneissia japonica]